MKKLTQYDLIVLHLAEANGWCYSYNLEKVRTSLGWIGSSGSRRARELAEDGTYTVKDMVYAIERRMNGRFVEYRVASSKMKPRIVYIAKVNAEGQTVRVPQLVC